LSHPESRHTMKGLVYVIVFLWRAMPDERLTTLWPVSGNCRGFTQIDYRKGM
jgi:hypothetical protein